MAERLRNAARTATGTRTHAHVHGGSALTHTTVVTTYEEATVAVTAFKNKEYCACV